MRFNKIRQNGDENPFALSTGDLMAGLLFIFILLLTATMLRVQEKAESDEEITREYNQIKTQLYIDLAKEFKDSLQVWNAIIDSTELIVRFQEPTTLFDFNKSELKPRFKNILKDFFPRYIKLISRSEYKENIEEIRIEGHTDSLAGISQIWSCRKTARALYLNIALTSFQKMNNRGLCSILQPMDFHLAI